MKEEQLNPVTRPIQFYVPRDLHAKVKTMAIMRNMTMRQYILQALLERITRDEMYE